MAPELKPSLGEIRFTLVVGCVVLVVTLFLFALAVRCRHTHVAPRCEARPREVIYNPDSQKDPSQDRGNPFYLGWVIWIMNLPYETLLKGVPGTGTRKGGLEGKLLSLNLDDIVMLRFHSMGLKISVMAMIIFCGISLPICITAPCVVEELILDDARKLAASDKNCSLEKNYAPWSYARFTLANIPALAEDSQEVSDLEFFRIYCIVFASWIVIWFACYELYHAWIDLLAMRRVYYLEYDHWSARKEQLRFIAESETNGNKNLQEQSSGPTDCHLYQRESWVPHPEQGDNPPSVELYSVLVGGVPSSPREFGMSERDLEEAAINGEQQVLEWQRSITSSYFDLCIAKQPGYSSSVAAVTILPSPPDLVDAWKTWRKASKTLSKLRFIQSRIVELGHTPESSEISGNHCDATMSLYKHDSYFRALHRMDDENDIYFEAIRARYFGAENAAAAQDVPNDLASWKSRLGPEQIAAYNMQMARSMTGCCPHGCYEQYIKGCRDIEKLYEMEAETEDDLQFAIEALQSAGKKAGVSSQKGTREALTERLIGPVNAQKAPQTRSSAASQLVHRNAAAKKKQKEKEEMPEGPQSTRWRAKIPHYASTLKQLSTKGSGQPSNEENRTDWDIVNAIAKETKDNSRNGKRKYMVSDGRWKILDAKTIRQKFLNLFTWTSSNANSAADIKARDSTHAVVTFTSRKAALAARQCLSNARGSTSFFTIAHLPVAPLADAAPLNLDPHLCCWPVTLKLNNNQLSWRRVASIILLVMIYIFYSIPIFLAAEFGSDVISSFAPNYNESDLEGMLDAIFLNSFLALAPQVFNWISNFASDTTNYVDAENVATMYYWRFLLLFAIVGSSAAQMATQAYRQGSFHFVEELERIAATIPVQVSSRWANWIIVRMTMVNPLVYLLQVGSWGFSIFGCNYFVRKVRRGDGSKIPFRWYADSGVVVFCVLALAPASPLVAPLGTLYFLISTPLLWYVLLFTYKPLYNSGGSRWPLLFQIVMTALFVSQILLAAMVLLKQAIAPAALALAPLVPTYMFRRQMIACYQKLYMDAALLQTSLLDGQSASNDGEPVLSQGDREQFRRYLIDSHKAAFIPACIAAADIDHDLTAETAEVVPTQRELDAAAQNTDSSKTSMNSTSNVEGSFE